MTSECIEWQGAKSPQGYGRLRIRGRSLQAHRWAWEQAHGPIPANVEICHRCDNPSCINLDHLWLGTHAENMADSWRKGRAAFATTKLTEEQVLEIRASGEPGNVLGDRYSVTRQAIWRIRHGHTWKHL